MREAACDGCKKIAMVNKAWFDSKRNCTEMGEFCADCFDRLNLGEIRRPPGGTAGETDEDSNGGWGNVTRALEEDR